MRQITIADVHLRLRGLKNENVNQTQNQFLIEGAHRVINSNNSKDIIRFLEGVSKSDKEIPFYTYIELFESVVEKGTIGDVSKAGNFITENIIHKVRDSKNTQSLIKRRLTRMQNKIKNGISKTFEDMSKRFKNKNNVGLKKEQAAVNIYESMLEKLVIMNHCDRVIENYNKISKRFNLDSLFIENTRYNGVTDTVVELCNRIDTYEMPIAVKFNTIIETAWYGFESNAIEYNKSEIIEAAIDYFAFKPNGISACKEILESTLFYDKNDDMKNIDIFMEEEPEKTDIPEDIEESVMLWNSTSTNTVQTPIRENSFEDIFNKFKEEELSKDDHPERKLKELVNKLYSRSVTSIIDGTPDLLHWIRRFFILGTGAVPVIGPVLMIISYIADKFISLHFDREEVPKMIKCFSNEIKASKNKMKSTQDNEEKENLKKYIESLENAKGKIENYYTDLLTDEEQESRYNDMDDDDFDFNLDDDYKDLIGDDDFDFDDDELLESAILRKILYTTNDFINNVKSNTINEGSMFNLVFTLNDDDLISVATITASYPETFHKQALVDAIEQMISDIRKNAIEFDTVISKVTRMSALQSALAILNSNKESDGEIDIYKLLENIISLNEAYRAINIMIDTYNNKHYLLEASISNTIKMASAKLKNAITRMSDKEKSISKSIDVGLNNFRKNIERSLTNDNRESIIKGSILPSASKLIKLCLVNIGLVALHQPLLAIISTIGYLGTSAKFKAKERQMIIDEIDIELNMCDKYISIAEQKNDMKALKQLLMTKKELERQQQRIRYKMKVEYGQKHPDSTETR